MRLDFKALGTDHRTRILEDNILKLSFFNLFLVALLGLTLRSFPFVDFGLDYKNLLHGHSHFAFGGWIMPLLTWLIMKYFPELKISFVHWRNITFLVLLSAYGMLASFPFEGYGVVSIIFSSLSVFGGYYLAFVIRRATKGDQKNISIQFLTAACFYLVLSSIGPFATGPLIAMGKAGSPLYFNSIYFYLHFQYNGWFSFAILAVLVKLLEHENKVGNARKVFLLMNIACAPSFFLSVLWTEPSVVFNLIGGVAALMQLTAAFYLLKDLRTIRSKYSFANTIATAAMAAWVLKLLLQTLSAFPLIARMAFENRNYVIAYLHLVLLGFISLAGLSLILNAAERAPVLQMKIAIRLFLFSLLTTELLLVIEPTTRLLNISMTKFPQLIFLFSCFFPLAAFMMVREVIGGKQALYNRSFKSLSSL